MAALCISHYFYSKKGHSSEPRRRKIPKIVILSSCQGRGPVNNSDSAGKKDFEGKFKFLKLVNGFEKIGKKMKENLSPQQKGDWKDLLLMSLSFAVYVYISQKLVCAYCAWTSMPKQLW